MATDDEDIKIDMNMRGISLRCSVKELFALLGCYGRQAYIIRGGKILTAQIILFM
jgi:hypothetical protein